ncbi:MAG TPA: GEVED domain-containing protein [bacterium]|nr:GEVED domain-containing protein [bacterium]
MKTTPWVFLALVMALLLLSLGVGCTCDDDDDDDDDSDDDDDDNDDNDTDDDDDATGPVDTVEQAIALLVDELDTSGESGVWVAYVTASPLAADVDVQPAEGESAYSPTGSYWFAFADEEPFAFFEHSVKFVFIAADTGVVTVESQSWWPEIDGVSFLGSGRELVQVFAPNNMSWRMAKATKAQPAATAPTGDYGDAPDNTVEDDPTQVYYGGAVSGQYPTLYETANSVDNRPGGHTLTTGAEMIGENVSDEEDANDTADPDGVPNLVDRDLDDGVFWVFYPDLTTNTLTVRFLVEVTVAAGAPDVQRYLNILVDANRDGQWKKNDRGSEWLTQNFVVEVDPGKSERVWTDAVAMPLSAANTFGWESWMRVALTRESIDTATFGDDGWDGSGQFEYGEIEDHYFNFEPWSADDDDDDDDDDPQPEDPAGDDPEPDPKECKYVCEADMIDIPIGCKALVINFGDRPGQSHVTRDAERAVGFYEDLLGAGNVQTLSEPTASAALQAIQDFIANAACLDELYIYLAGHGGKSGYIRAQNGRGKMTPEQLKNAIGSGSHCPATMDYYAGECRQPGFCNLNIVIISCYAGNFTTGDNSIAQAGVNVLAASDKNTSARGRPNGDGAYVSNAYFEAYEGNQADDPPNGDGDGEVSAEEAMDWAKDNYGGPDTGASTQLGADCECVCNTPGWSWPDLENDLIYWYLVGEPTYVGHLDIIQYGIVPFAGGFYAQIRTATNLPGGADTGFHEYYAVFDTDLPNFVGEGVTHDGDTAYIAQFLNGVWKMFLFVYNDTSHTWVNTPTTSTVVVEGQDLTMTINNEEAGINFIEEFAPTRMATWYREDETIDAGDDTEIQDGTEGHHCF